MRFIAPIAAVAAAAALLPASAQAQREGQGGGGYSGTADDEIAAWTQCIGESVFAAPMTAADTADALVATAYAACTAPRAVMEEAINTDPNNRITFYAAEVLGQLDMIIRDAVGQYVAGRQQAGEAQTAE